VVCGEGTFDEISICGPTKVAHLKNDNVSTFQMTPEEFDFKRADLEDIVGGDAKENANITRHVLGGEKGPKRDMVLLNASAAFVAAGLCDNFKEGIQIAADSIDSGNAQDKLDQLIEFTRQCQPFVRS
jgi:anthranilate phosphoribosyltransferase